MQWFRDAYGGNGPLKLAGDHAYSQRYTGSGMLTLPSSFHRDCALSLFLSLSLLLSLSLSRHREPC